MRLWNWSPLHFSKRLSAPHESMSKDDAPKVDLEDDAPKVDAPQVDTPNVDAPRELVSKVDAEVDAPRELKSKTDAPNEIIGSCPDMPNNKTTGSGDTTCDRPQSLSLEQPSDVRHKNIGTRELTIDQLCSFSLEEPSSAAENIGSREDERSGGAIQRQGRFR